MPQHCIWFIYFVVFYKIFLGLRIRTNVSIADWTWLEMVLGWPQPGSGKPRPCDNIQELFSSKESIWRSRQSPGGQNCGRRVLLVRQLRTEPLRKSKLAETQPQVPWQQLDLQRTEGGFHLLPKHDGPEAGNSRLGRLWWEGDPK